MTKANFSKKFWAFLIAFLMLVTTFPLTALAEGEAQEPADTSQPVETAQPEDSPQPEGTPLPEDSQQPEDSPQPEETPQPAEGPLLSGLSVIYGDANLLADFSKDIFSYSVDAGAEADKVSITATPATEGDTVEGTGEFTLNIGENVFTVTVSRTAEGSEPLKQVYVITIIRAAQALSGDCSLASLKVTAGETELTLDPAFGPAVTEYKIATDAIPVNIEAAANDTGAKVEGTGHYDLAAGDNKFTVKVTAADGTIKEYNITITTPSGISAQAISGYYEYSISGGKATIIYYNGYEEYITTPTTLGGYPVTAIGNYAFEYCYGVTGITISAGVTAIGDYAFYECEDLETVTLPSSLISIGEGAFNDCFCLEAITVDSLNTAYSSPGGVLFNKSGTELIKYPCGKSETSYTIPDGVTTIDDKAFEYSNLKSVVIPAGVTEIGAEAFYCCSDLESVNIPAGVTGLGFNAFYACSKLNEINIPASVQTIGTRAFEGCRSLEAINVDSSNADYASEGGVLFGLSGGEKTTLIQYPAGKGDISYSIPGTVETIGENAFADSVLRDINIPGSVTSIGMNAFYYCNNLYSIEISDSVANLNDSFAYCPNLTDVVFMGDCPSAGSEFIYCEALTVYYLTGKTGFPVDDWDVRQVAFDPDADYTLTYDGNGAVDGSAPAGGTYKYGDPVTMPYNTGGLVKQPYAFTGWNVAENGGGIGYAPDETYHMGPHNVTLYADWQTSCKLKSLQVLYDWGYELPPDPAFSPDVFEYTLEVDNKIDMIYLGAEPEFNEDDVDWDSDYEEGGIPLHVGENDIEVTVSSDDGRENIYTVVITRLPATDEKTFGYYKYKDEGTYIQITKYTGKETHAIVPDHIDNKPVTKIGMNAFYNNLYIESVSLQDGITDIEAAAFRYCFYLESVTMPDTLKNIGSEAFFNCPRLSSVSLPGSLISIGSSAFSYCYALTGFSIPDNVASIGEPFLAGCEEIETISIGSNPNFTVEDGVLFNAGKTRLIRYPAKKSGASYSIPSTVTDIDESAFDSALVGSVTVPGRVTVLDYDTFANCGNLSSVSLPESLEEIWNWAFYNCTSLESIELPKNLYYIDGNVFEGCTGMTSVSVDADNENYLSTDGVLYCYDEYYDEDSDEYIDAYGLVYYPAGLGTSFHVPYNVCRIYQGAFVSCQLKEINIGGIVQEIEWGVFEDCDNLISITIPDGVSEINDGTFIGCENLCTATIGAGAYYVDLYAFYDCPKLAAVYFLGDAPETEYDYDDYGGASARAKHIKSVNKFKSDLEHAPLELQQRYSGMVKTQGIIKAQATVKAQATAKLFPGSSSSLTVYKASGTHYYTNPWRGRPVKTFYPSQTCTVKFSLNGKAGEPIADQVVYKYGKAAQPLNPTNPDVRFLGWYKEASCVNKWSFATSTVSSNITLYAKWTNKSVITAKSGNTDYGTVSGGGTYTDGDVVTLRATPKPGYRFLCWTEPMYGYDIYVTDEEVYTFTAAGNRTLTARFAAIGKPAITSISSPKYDSVSLTWNPVIAATSYKVYRATSSTGTYTKVAENLTETTYTNTGLQWGKTYYYKVSAVCVCSTATTQGAKSSYKSKKPVWQTLTLNASNDHNYGVELSWNTVADADSYKVYRSTSYSGTYSELAGSVTETSYTDSSAVLNKTYYYKVKPVDKVEGSDDVIGPFSAYKAGKAAWTTIKLTAAAKTYSSIALSWNAVTDATSYDVLRCETYNGTYAEIPAATGLTALGYVDEGLTVGKTYYYKLTAHAGLSSITSGYKYAKPAWPTISLKAASNTYNSILLTWKPVAGATAYDVLRCDKYNGTYAAIPAATGLTTLSYIDEGLTEGKTYYYKIKAYDGINSATSGYKYAKPAWPTVSIKAASNTYNSILLTWKPVAGATAYDVLRCSKYNGTYTAIPAATGLTALTLSYTDTGLTTGKTYYYKLRAYDGPNSKTSSYKYAKPAWPTLKLTAKSDSYNSIKLTWNEIAGATRYEILRGTSYTKITTPLGDTPDLTYVDSGTSGLTPGKTYYYKVRPVDWDNLKYGPYCSYKYAKPVPSAPDVTLDSFSGGIIGTWAAIAGAVKYEVYRATSKSGTYTKIVTTAGLSFWNVPLTAGKTYYYKVRAYTYVGTTKIYGAYSAVKNLTATAGS